MPAISSREWMTLAKLEDISANQRKDLPKDQVYLRELTAEEVAYTDMGGYKGRVFERKNVKISIETVPDERPKIVETIPDHGSPKAAKPVLIDNPAKTKRVLGRISDVNEQKPKFPRMK